MPQTALQTHLGDFWSMVSIKFSIFQLAFEEFLDKNFMAVLWQQQRVSWDYTASLRQHRDHTPSKHQLETPYNRRSNGNVNHPQRSWFLNIMAGTVFQSKTQTKQFKEELCPAVCLLLVHKAWEASLHMTLVRSSNSRSTAAHVYIQGKFPEAYMVVSKHTLQMQSTNLKL